jgi:hypothetical protein
LHELRALPQRRFRLANIELPKTEAWAQRQREKGVLRRMLDVVNEPRFKFYVKEGRLYTMKTKVPGVWEEVAERIRDQTIAEKEEQERKSRDEGAAVVKRPVVLAKKPNKPVLKVDERLRRQTTRSLRK